MIEIHGKPAWVPLSVVEPKTLLEEAHPSPCSDFLKYSLWKDSAPHRPTNLPTDQDINSTGCSQTESQAEDVDKILSSVRSTCPFCGKRLKDEQTVEKHVKMKHRKPFECDLCNRAFRTSQEVGKHKIGHENEDLECSVCNLKYKTKMGLKQHRIRTHSSCESKYICDHCGKSYKLKNDLMLHIGRTHMTEKSVCRYCGKEVRDVRNHEWQHQRRSRVTNYKYPCSLCAKKFHTKMKLDNHLVKHKQGFRCPECEVECRSPKALANHRRLKHNPACMICTICKKVFPSSSNFYQHVLTHAGIRPYKCDICDENFTQRSPMLRHRKSHPGPLPPTPPPTAIAELAKRVLQKF
ncbi:zinc finger protein 84 isoform X2 [Orussus abietinus]|nr:zinc finger protein 84 isoform X2 [Orussus abietinus]